MVGEARGEVRVGMKSTALDTCVASTRSMIADLEEWMCLAWVGSSWDEAAVSKRSFCMKDQAAVL